MKGEWMVGAGQTKWMATNKCLTDFVTRGWLLESWLALTIG